MSEEHVSPERELNAIESALGSLVPARSRMDRDRVMFLAGRSAFHPSSAGRRIWATMAAGLALVAAGEAALLARRPPPQIIKTVVVVHEPEAPRVVPPTSLARAPTGEPRGSGPVGGDFGLGQTPHDRLAGQVLRYGLDGLPAPPSASWSGAGMSPTPSHQLLLEELRKTLNPGDPS